MTALEPLYPVHGIANEAYSRALDEHPDAETDSDEVGLSFLSEAVMIAFNPPDNDVAFESLLAEAIERAALFIEAQPCRCIDPDEPCRRCAVLGRSANKVLDR